MVTIHLPPDQERRLSELAELQGADASTFAQQILQDFLAFKSASPDFAAYLLDEAKRCGITIEEAIEEEIAANAELRRLTPDRETLARLAAEHRGAPSYLAGEKLP